MKYFVKIFIQNGMEQKINVSILYLSKVDYLKDVKITSLSEGARCWVERSRTTLWTFGLKVSRVRSSEYK